MQCCRTIACAAAVGMVAACAHHTAKTGVTTTSTGDVTSSSSPVSVSAHWGAVVTPVGSASVRGRVDIAPTPGGKSATMILVLTGLEPGGTYTWHIRRGLCAAVETAGPPSEYAPLTADARGHGSSTGTFPMANANMAGYHIDVHPTGAPAVACGDLESASHS